MIVDLKSCPPLRAAACLFLALVIPVLGSRTAVAYLNMLSAGPVDSASPGDTPQLEPRDRKPKPTRQQLRVSVDRESRAKASLRRLFGREAQRLSCVSNVTPPVRGQRAFGAAKHASTIPDYMKQQESPQSSLAPPG